MAVQLLDVHVLEAGNNHSCATPTLTWDFDFGALVLRNERTELHFLQTKCTEILFKAASESERR